MLTIFEFSIPVIKLLNSQDIQHTDKTRSTPSTKWGINVTTQVFGQHKDQILQFNDQHACCVIKRSLVWFLVQHWQSSSHHIRN